MPLRTGSAARCSSRGTGRCSSAAPMGWRIARIAPAGLPAGDLGQARRCHRCGAMVLEIQERGGTDMVTCVHIRAVLCGLTGEMARRRMNEYSAIRNSAAKLSDHAQRLRPVRVQYASIRGSARRRDPRRGLCAPAWSTAPGRRPDPGRCWQLTTPRLIEINGSLAVLKDRSADSFEYQMLHGIRLAFRRLLLRAGESSARRYRALPQARRAAISAIADTRASGGPALSAVDRAGRGCSERLGQTAWFVLDPAGPACTGTVDGSRQDSGPIYDGAPGRGAWRVKGRW
jgi:hypothetical protein